MCILALQAPTEKGAIKENYRVFMNKELHKSKKLGSTIRNIFLKEETSIITREYKR